MLDVLLYPTRVASSVVESPRDSSAASESVRPARSKRKRK